MTEEEFVKNDYEGYSGRIAFAKLIGKTFASVDVVGRNEILRFTTVGGFVLEMRYEPDCCADCRVEEISGELSDLVGSPIVFAEEVSNQSDVEHGSNTWTFYKIGTTKGTVTIRWFGESNGYYSESPGVYAVSPR